MIRMQVSEAAKQLGASYKGPDRLFEGCVIDSRHLPAGALFVALPGQKNDGHDFVPSVAEIGAVAAMVERGDIQGKLPMILVPDCRHGLWQLSGIWRQRCHCQLIGITGSNGKTSVKELLAAILAKQGPTLATQGNFNNDLGVPLTLLRLDSAHRFAVVEMGANHPQEIADLAKLAKPDVGVITRCAPAHLEGFGSIEGVARAKGELIEQLPDTGVAIINADDPYADLWHELAGNRRVITFGLENPADVSTAYRLTPEGAELTLKTPAGDIDTHMHLPGRHNVLNALAATAAALAVECSPSGIAVGLESARSVTGRLQIKKGHGDVRILDDSYNANPDSLAAGLDVLAGFQAPRWLILGDMAELGDEAPQLHWQAGKLASESGVSRLFAIGPLGLHAVEGFGARGHHYEDTKGLVDDVIRALSVEAVQGVTMLVKGSRHMRMERVVEGVLAMG